MKYVEPPITVADKKQKKCVLICIIILIQITRPYYNRGIYT